VTTSDDRKVSEDRREAAAIGGFVARLAPIDQDDRQPPFPNGIGRRYADDARTQHDDVRCLTFHPVRHRRVRPPLTGNRAPVTCSVSANDRKATLGRVRPIVRADWPRRPIASSVCGLLWKFPDWCLPTTTKLTPAQALPLLWHGRDLCSGILIGRPSLELLEQGFGCDFGLVLSGSFKSGSNFVARRRVPCSRGQSLSAAG
jgi:hypothetical protein